MKKTPIVASKAFIARKQALIALAKKQAAGPDRNLFSGPTCANLPFPEVSAFNDLFDQYKPFVLNDGYPNIICEGKTISSYCCVDARNYRSLHVVPNKLVVEFIGKNMISIDYDSIYIRITCRNDATALVSAQYNQIIGSRWLALIDPRTIPK